MKTSWEQLVRLPDLIPMLASKGFNAMIEHWLEVVSKGKLADDILERSLRTHLLAETIYQQVEKWI